MEIKKKKMHILNVFTIIHWFTGCVQTSYNSDMSLNNQECMKGKVKLHIFISWLNGSFFFIFKDGRFTCNNCFVHRSFACPISSHHNFTDVAINEQTNVMYSFFMARSIQTQTLHINTKYDFSVQYNANNLLFENCSTAQHNLIVIIWCCTSTV